ncbi:TSUP family transporter [Halobacteriovorax sp. RZ-1]|uniref:TSUP family transporter n=1 Tax=unclassified Halobacteriovorax TaxID=2639665 RepID=UPI00371DCD65
MDLESLFFYILFTSIISGALGMAGGIILMAIFLVYLPLPVALILQGITQASSNGFRAAVNYKNIEFKVVLPYLLGTAIAYGVFQGIELKLSKKVIFIILGILPIIGLLKPLAIHFDIEKRGRALLCGLIVSSSQALSGVSGSALDLFFLSSRLGRFSIVATKAFTQMLGHLAKTIFFIRLYEFNLGEMPYTFYFVAIFTPLLGAVTGKMILKKMSNRYFVKVAKVVMVGFSGSMIYRGVMM